MIVERMKLSEMTAGRGDAENRLSSLPQNIKNHILARVPVVDVAKLSILSSKWRHTLSEHPHLDLDEEFFKEILQKNPEDQDYYVYVVNRILLQHYGPIQDFDLYVPFISSDKFVDVDQWMLFLSRKGVKKLTLRNSNPLPYKLPSYIFSYPLLIALCVKNCIFKPPTAFKGFSKLTRLISNEVTFESSVLHFPHLTILQLERCRGTHILNISAPLLEVLVLISNYDIELSYYVKCKYIESVCILLPDELQHCSEINLAGLFDCWTKLSKAMLDGEIFNFMAAGTIPVTFPTNMNCLRRLTVCYICYDLNQMACIVCLLQSSPNLQKFDIESDSEVNNDVDVLNYLEEVVRMNQTLFGLRIVDARSVHGSKAELLFVKLLLACCPSLERMYIEAHEELQLSQCLSMAKDLMCFPRASPKAEMVFNSTS